MRHVVLVLLLIANAGYFAWTSGWLRDWGLVPATQSEPQRLAQQIRPEALRILGTGNASAVAAPSTEPTAVTALPSPSIMTSRAITTPLGTTIRITPAAVPPTSNGVAAVAAAVQAAASIAAMAPASAAAPAQPIQQTP